ncbi:ribosome maturation protein RimP [Sphingomonas sp. 1P06PA]|uniref:ribosome maturation protein RimP n=1 Tax=Sphingomonas sp. 1P06PA TaxID=554121 RepID=UPI0039A56B64
MADIAELTRLIEPEAEALGLSLVRVQMFGGKSDPTLQVMAERPDTRQLDIADCEALSRRISDVLDANDPIEEAYRLEVSSPGIDRPLTRLADFEDWAGFDARIKLVEKIDGRKQFDARLIGVAGDAVVVQPEKSAEMTIPFAAIQSAKLILTDALMKATAPLSSAGADEFIEEAPTEGVDEFINEAPLEGANDLTQEG